MSEVIAPETLVGEHTIALSLASVDLFCVVLTVLAAPHQAPRARFV